MCPNTMSGSLRIDLENKIFARACAVNAPIEAREGGLFSASSDAQLNALLGVYNAYFRAENWQTFGCPQEELEAWKNYVLTRVYPPGLKSQAETQAWKFELILL